MHRPVFSEIKLHSTTPNAMRGKFDVAALTGHASINLTFIDAPVDSVLNISAKVAGADGDWAWVWGDDWEPDFWDIDWDFDPDMPARVTVQLPESFEGIVDLEMHEPTVFRPQIVSFVDDMSQMEMEHNGVTDGIGSGPDALRQIIVSLEEVAAGWDCSACTHARRVDANPSEPDGRALMGSVSWGKDKVSVSDMEDRGKVVVRTEDSPIILII